MRALHPTTFWTRLQNTLPTPTTPAAAVLSSSAASTVLARLLPSHVPLLAAADNALPPLPHRVHTVAHTRDLRPAARWAIEHSVRHLILPTTRLEHALSALTANASDTAAIDVLPPRTLTLHHPLINTHEQVLDATASALLPPPHPSFQRLVAEALGSVDVSAVLRHTKHKQAALRSLNEDTDALLHDSVVEASHWGYVVARRSTLAAVFHSPRGKLRAVHALSRIILHVSGSSTRLPLDDEHVTRMAADLLRLEDGKLAPLPKGRTAAGVVARPATGRFARRLERDTPDNLMIFTREPDHESAGLHAMRLRGNYACAPLGEKAGVYWDNRFVLMAGRVKELSEEHPPLRMKDVLLAALDAQDDIKQRLIDAEFYVRQIRRADWERITASASRVRDFQVPFHCIRALPAIIQKEPGSTRQGELIASPHLGISARSDMYFTAVCMPRFRSLPEGICPGFVDEYIGDRDTRALY